MNDILRNDKFVRDIKTRIYGKELFVFDILDSTNKYAMNELENRIIEEGTCYLALSQTAGIGTSGNSWESDKAFGMWLSTVLNSPVKKEPLVFVPAVAMVKMLKNYCNISAHLKWPNDVLVGNKKITGILVQAKDYGSGHVSFVLGVGLNISQRKNDFSSEIIDIATSILIETGEHYNLEDLYKEYMKYFEMFYTDESINIVDEWIKHSNMIDKIITMKRDNEIIKVKVLSITKEGYLEIENIKNRNIEIIQARAGIDIKSDYE